MRSEKIRQKKSIPLTTQAKWSDLHDLCNPSRCTYPATKYIPTYYIPLFQYLLYFQTLLVLRNGKELKEILEPTKVIENTCSTIYLISAEYNKPYFLYTFFIVFIHQRQTLTSSIPLLGILIELVSLSLKKFCTIPLQYSQRRDKFYLFGNVYKFFYIYVKNKLCRIHSCVNFSTL